MALSRCCDCEVGDGILGAVTEALAAAVPPALPAVLMVVQSQELTMITWTLPRSDELAGSLALTERPQPDSPTRPSRRGL